MNITPGTSAQTIAAGYHNGSGQVAGDANLVAGNIKSGTNIFGVTGTLAPTLAKRVAQTGQTQCWDPGGTLLGSCNGTGQDGQYKMGITPAIAPVVGTTGAYNTPAWTGSRFTDNGNGTITDNVTALIWLKIPACAPTTTWPSALGWTNSLASGMCNLSDGSTAGQWRMPNVNELHSLIDLTQTSPALPSGFQVYFNVNQYGTYWSSTTWEIDPRYVWTVTLGNGDVNHFPTKTGTSLTVWPVRGGQ